MNVHSYIKPET